LHRRRSKIRFISSIFAAFAVFVGYLVVRSVLTMKDVTPKNEKVFSSDNHTFSDITYKVYNNGAKGMSLKSSEVQKVENGSLSFKKLVSNFRISENKRGTISADRTFALDEAAKQCKFIGNVKLSTDDGLSIRTDLSFVDFDKQTARGNSPVSVIQNDMELRANQYDFDLMHQIFTLIDHAEGHIKQDLINADKLIIELADIGNQSVKKVNAIGNALYKSEYYSIRATKCINYTPDNVDAYQNANLVYSRNGTNYDISANHIFGKLKANKVERAKMMGNLVIKFRDSVIYGDEGFFQGNILTVVDNVSILNPKGKIICDKAELNTTTNDMKIYNSKGMISKGISDEK